VENLATTISILIGAIYIALPVFVKVSLSEYTAGIVSARILLFGFFLHGIAGLAGNLFLATKKQVLYLRLLLGSGLLSFGLSFAVLKFGYGITER